MTDTHTVNVGFNQNVMSKVVTMALDSRSDDEAIQELVDSIYANMLVLMTMLDNHEAGRLTGRILTDALYHASRAKAIS